MNWYQILFLIIGICGLVMLNWERIKLIRDRDRWRREAVAVAGHMRELERAIEKRCVHFDDEYSWCQKYEQFAECVLCFVQDGGYDEVTKGCDYRAQFGIFADGWDDPEMDVYNNI